MTASRLICVTAKIEPKRPPRFAGRLHERLAFELQKEEGLEWFGRRQRFLGMTAKLAATGRLSCFLHVAERAT
jgi:hypothetical protein